MLDYDLAQRAALIYTIDAYEKGFPAGTTFLPSSCLSITARDLFLAVGLLQSPATGPSDKRCWAFLIEYGESFRGSSGHIRVVGSEDWNSRMRGAFGERIGVGVAGLLLWRHYGAVHIADAGYFIGRTIQDPKSHYDGTALKSLGLYGNTGELEPDFFCLTAEGKAVIAEAKGALGPPSAVADGMKHGKEQVKNVEVAGIPERAVGNRLVFGVSLRSEADRPQNGKDSQVTILDPPANDGALVVPVTPNEIILHSYAKAFRFAGEYVLADAFVRGRLPRTSEDVIRDFSIAYGDLRVFPVTRVGGLVVGLAADVARKLFVRAGPEIPRDLQESLAVPLAGVSTLLTERPSTSEEPLLLPNGIVIAFDE